MISERTRPQVTPMQAQISSEMALWRHSQKFTERSHKLCVAAVQSLCLLAQSPASRIAAPETHRPTAAAQITFPLFSWFLCVPFAAHSFWLCFAGRQCEFISSLVKRNGSPENNISERRTHRRRSNAMTLGQNLRRSLLDSIEFDSAICVHFVDCIWWEGRTRELTINEKRSATCSYVFAF